MPGTPETNVPHGVNSHVPVLPDGRAGYLSVLCVFDDPLFLDRLCRNLERSGDMFVEFSISPEDALHLMVYVQFDVIVTDCMSWQGEDHGFLKAMRRRGKDMPLIYFFRCPDPAHRVPPPPDKKVWSLAWDGDGLFPPFEELTRYIHAAVAPSAPD